MREIDHRAGKPVLKADVVTAVVLAAGLGRRMLGPNKLLLPVHGEAMVRRVVEQALASRCGRVLVVLGFEAARVRQALEDLPVEFVVNEGFEEGLGSSVRAGALAVRDGSAAVICLGDMPLVDAPVIDALIHAYETGAGVKACQPLYDGRRGNPVLWGADCLPDLRRLGGDEGARALLLRLGGALALVDAPSPAVLRDIDTPDDLRSLEDS